MKFTNKLGLPEAIVEAVRNDGYSRGDADISVTGLLRPPRLATLEKQHADEIVEDASDRIWALMGQSVHMILERANRTAIAERRLSIEVEGWRVSGGMDLYEESGSLFDYKVTTKYKLKDGQVPEEWIQQLNLYAVMLRHHGHKVEKLQVIAMLRDWSKMEAQRDVLYPQSQVMNVDIPLWTSEKAEKFLRERVILHQQARVNLPECSPEDRWAKPDTWAVMKQGGKRAVKLYSNEDEAKTHVGFDRALYVQFRPGVSTRCDSYCAVSKFCTQYQSSLASTERPTADVIPINQAKS